MINKIKTILAVVGAFLIGTLPLIIKNFFSNKRSEKNQKKLSELDTKINKEKKNVNQKIKENDTTKIDNKIEEIKQKIEQKKEDIKKRREGKKGEVKNFETGEEAKNYLENTSNNNDNS